MNKIENSSVLVTGGAGFIGSNLVDRLLSQNNKVVCLDNFSTGFESNLTQAKNNKNFTLIKGDIRDIKTCHLACENVDVVLHQAALGSVPRSIVDPITTNEVNITGFVNILIAARDAKVKRVVYAASSSTYGDSHKLPKLEDEIGKPLSPYAITKYVNELYADVFSKTYKMEIIGLRYFNVFGPRQTPDGAYAAVIPLFVKQLINKNSPVINGDGTFSRDFTYIENVIQANQLAATTNSPKAINTVFNVAYGAKTSLNELIALLKKYLEPYISEVKNVEIAYGSERLGDIPHSLASIEKASKLLDYKPTHNIEQGLKEAIHWYWTSLNENQLK